MPVFTVGHSNHPLEKFLDLLKANGIEVLADVRSHPRARYATHFDGQALRRAVMAAGMTYSFLGAALGGMPDRDEFYDDEGNVLYSEMAKTPKFREGIERLAGEAERRRVVIMCGEEDPTDCHRRRLIGRVLRERGFEVVHIRGDGRLQTEAELEAEERGPESPQLSLFGGKEEEKPWKSSQSVLPKGRRPDSSER